MRVIAIVCMRNEADIVESFVRHTFHFCHEMLVLNHGSTDATADILTRLKDEGLALRVISDFVPGRLHDLHMNRLLKLAVEECGADWVLCLDADEFICGVSDASFLPPQVEKESPSLRIPLRLYYPQPNDDGSLVNPVERIIHRTVRETWSKEWIGSKSIVPAWMVRERTGRLDYGNHRFFIDNFEAPYHLLANPTLGHFSIRSASQYGEKLVSKRMQALCRISPKSSGYRQTYESDYQKLRESYSRFNGELTRHRLWNLEEGGRAELIADSIPYLGGELRYTLRSSDSDIFIRNVLDLFENVVLSMRDQTSSSPGKEDEIPNLFIRCSYGADTREAPKRGMEIQLGRFHTLACPINGVEEALLHLDVAANPGILDIAEITLCFPLRSQQVFGFEALKAMLWVPAGGIALPSVDTCRFLISRERQLSLAFQGWKTGNDFPAEIRIKFRMEEQADHVQKIVCREDTVVFLNRNLLELAQCREEIEDYKRLLAKSTYEIGTVLDFASGGNFGLFSATDWNAPEPWGRWTEGARASLKFQFATAPRRELSLELLGRPLLVPSQAKLVVKIHARGKMIGEWVFDQPDFEWKRIQIAQDLVQEKSLELVFEIDHPICLKELGLSDDPRHLGLGVAQVLLK